MKNSKTKIVLICDESGMDTIKLNCRKLFTLLTICLLCSFGYSQTAAVKQPDGTYSAQAKAKTESKAKDTGKKFRLPDGTTTPIMESKNGKFFVIRISKKTNLPYNQYITLN